MSLLYILDSSRSPEWRERLGFTVDSAHPEMLLPRHGSALSSNCCGVCACGRTRTLRRTRVFALLVAPAPPTLFTRLEPFVLITFVLSTDCSHRLIFKRFDYAFDFLDVLTLSLRPVGFKGIIIS